MTSPPGPWPTPPRRNASRGSAQNSPRSVASTRAAAPAGGGGGGGSKPPSRARRGGSHSRRPSRRTIRRRRILAVVLAVFVLFFGWLSISLGSALTNPSLGTSASARFAEWGRAHHMGGLVTWLENEWLALNPPKKGGKPPAGAFKTTTSTTLLPASCAGALPVPAAVISPATPALPGEGSWSPIGRDSAGCPAAYSAFVRPDNVHTSYVAGIVWMDPKLLSFTLYSGSQIPGGGPYTNTAPIKPSAAQTLVTAFNAGFRMQDAQGGYYTDGKTVLPLVPGAASAVIYKDGTMNIGAWGSDVTMNSNVVSVRQNLALIVANGKAVPGLNSSDNSKWGLTLGGAATVWRSGMGVTANGAEVYVAGPAMSITALADLLVRAGCVRAMELDINTDWVQYSYYDPPLGQLASPANGKPLLADMAAGSAGPSRYFATWWTRDFFTTSARYAANGTMSTPKTTTTKPAKK